MTVIKYLSAIILISFGAFLFVSSCVGGYRIAAGGELVQWIYFALPSSYMGVAIFSFYGAYRMLKPKRKRKVGIKA